jgi:hypothetical protein
VLVGYRFFGNHGGVSPEKSVESSPTPPLGVA